MLAFGKPPREPFSARGGLPTGAPRLALDGGTTWLQQERAPTAVSLSQRRGGREERARLREKKDGAAVDVVREEGRAASVRLLL